MMRHTTNHHRNRLLRFVDEGLQQAALGAEPVAIVDEPRIPRHEIVLEREHLAVERDRLHRPVRLEQDGASGGFVAAARFHAHVAVFHQVEAADSVLPAELVERAEHLSRAHLAPVDGYDVALGIGELYVLRPVGRFLG